MRPTRIPFLRYVSNYELVPRGYGMAWRPMDENAILVAPVPLHWLYFAVRVGWNWLRYPHFMRTPKGSCPLCGRKP